MSFNVRSNAEVINKSYAVPYFKKYVGKNEINQIISQKISNI